MCVCLCGCKCRYIPAAAGLVVGSNETSVEGGGPKVV